MKKILSTAITVLMTVVAMGQQPVLTLTSPDTHDFGKINEADGRVTTIFEFKNEGMTPLVLSNVRASCGCTTPKWTREPIEPGQTGQITVTYNPNGRPGRFQKTITITSNATENTKRVYIKGEVIPKPATPVDMYPVKMGALALKSRTIDFGSIMMGENKNMEIEYTNQGQEELSVEVIAPEQVGCFDMVASMSQVKPREIGKMQASLISTYSQMYGPVETTVYVVVNKTPKLENAYAITLKGDIKEDFSKLTVEQLRLAPIAEASNKDVQMGSVKVGKKMSYKLPLKNLGINPLLVRRVLLDAPGVKVTMPKASIKSGKKADIRLDINAIGMEPSAYSRQMTIITNDPNNPIMTITLNWIVE